MTNPLLVFPCGCHMEVKDKGWSLCFCNIHCHVPLNNHKLVWLDPKKQQMRAACRNLWRELTVTNVFINGAGI